MSELTCYFAVQNLHHMYTTFLYHVFSYFQFFSKSKMIHFLSKKVLNQYFKIKLYLRNTFYFINGQNIHSAGKYRYYQNRKKINTKLDLS